MTPEEVNAMLDAAGDLTVVDVREESEFCDSTYQPPGHIVGAINMPWYSGYLEEHYSELPLTDDIVVVCRSGNRSHSAANFLDSVGFTRVLDMLGGMNAWQWDTEDCAAASTRRPEAVPTTLSVGPASPNPFSLRTEISYTIPAGSDATHATLTMYDSRGRLVTTILDRNHRPGTHQVAWAGTDHERRRLAAGIYFYRLTWNAQTTTGSIVLIR